MTAATSKLKTKCEELQLRLPLAVAPTEHANFDTFDKLFLHMELAKFPFFLAKRSEKVTISRRGYVAYKKMESLKRKKVSINEIEKKTTYQTSPLHTISTYTDSEETEAYSITEDWTILANQNYGLLDENDGYVWDYILKLISETYHLTNQFYLFYSFSVNDIANDFVKCGYYTARNGILNEIIRDSIERLHLTSFRHAKGFFRKDTKTSTTEEYNFNLISAVYTKGQQLPDGTISTNITVAIDPVIIANFKAQYFIITLNSLRKKLMRYSSKAVFDKLSFLTYNSLETRDFYLLSSLKMQRFVFLGYENLTQFLGLKPIDQEGFKKSRIEKQLGEIFSELLAARVINQKPLLDQFQDKTGKICCNVIFLLSDEFVDTVLKFSSRSLRERNAPNGEKVPTEYTNTYFKKFMKIVHEEANIKVISNVN